MELGLGRRRVQDGPYLHAISMHSACTQQQAACNQHAISMHSACTQHAISMQSARNQHAISMPSACHQHAISMALITHSACTQHALSMHSARNQHAISMQSSYLHVAPTAKHLARVAPRHRAEEPCAACGIVVAPDPAEIERCPTSLLCRTLRLPLRGRMHAELTHLWDEGGAPW